MTDRTQIDSHRKSVTIGIARQAPVILHEYGVKDEKAGPGIQRSARKNNINSEIKAGSGSQLVPSSENPFETASKPKKVASLNNNDSNKSSSYRDVI